MMAADPYAEFKSDPYAEFLKPAASTPLASAQDKVGGKEMTEGPLGFLNGLAEIVGKGLGNMPVAAVHGLMDIASRATGRGGTAPSEPKFPLSPNAQEVGTSIGGELSKAAEPYRVKAAEPFLNENVAPVVSDVAAIAPVVGAVRGVTGAIGAASDAASAARAATAPAAVTKYGLRTGQESPIARNVAGESAQPTVTAHNQAIADPTLGAQAGVAPGTPLTPQALEQGREAPESVYSRAENAIPTGHLSPNATAAVQGVGADDMVVHSPDTQATIDAQKARLLSGPLTGSQVVNAQRALRFNGFRNTASLDPEQSALGGAQLKMADALHQHMVDTIPPNADVSADQLSAARTALAQNHTVDNLLEGGNVDLQGLARLHRDNPNMLTGPLRDFAEFADLHPEVSSLPSKGERFNPSGFGKDVASVDLKSPVSYLQPFFGKLARRVLTGEKPPVRTPTTGLAGEFGPIDRTPQPPPGLTASTPTAPPAPAAGPPGQIPLADVLAHRVEQGPSQGLSLAPMGAPSAAGIPFNINAEHAAGGLSLDEGLNGPFRGKPMDMSDFASVKSQGVPEGIVQRSPSSRVVADTIDFPSGTQRRRIVENASNVESEGGANPASLEAQRRLAAEKAAGTRPVMVGPEGDEQPLLHDVTAVDRNPAKDGIILDASTGKIINSGGMKPAAAQALVNRWRARRSLGEAF